VNVLQVLNPGCAPTTLTHLNQPRIPFRQGTGYALNLTGGAVVVVAV
jgi:hypothetical protein